MIIVIVELHPPTVCAHDKFRVSLWHNNYINSLRQWCFDLLFHISFLNVGSRECTYNLNKILDFNNEFTIYLISIVKLAIAALLDIK